MKELKEQDPLARQGSHDSVQKMRVATRRMRSALAVYRKLVDDGKLVSDPSYALLGVNSSDQADMAGDPDGGQETLPFETFQSTNNNDYISIPAYP